MKTEIALIDGFKTFKDTLNYLGSKEFIKDLNYYQIELSTNWDIVIKNVGIQNYAVHIIERGLEDEVKHLKECGR